ncbi:hypothetical protein EV379_2847 [Microterricola gilva]|uniref:Uncharacterized protein n=1 Tax=Microterricola gilva TaxID=393267 RepID=A0A4Q8AR16_9MICO|nr:hypothetical protein EV379_2847 [Microterricola gilva]
MSGLRGRPRSSAAPSSQRASPVQCWSRRAVSFGCEGRRAVSFGRLSARWLERAAQRRRSSDAREAASVSANAVALAAGRVWRWLRGRPRSSAAPSSQRALSCPVLEPACGFPSVGYLHAGLSERRSDEGAATHAKPRARLRTRLPSKRNVSDGVRASGAASFLGCSLEPACFLLSRAGADVRSPSAARAGVRSPSVGYLHAGLSERRSDEGAATHAKPRASA